MSYGCAQEDLEFARGIARNDPACVTAFFNAYHHGVYRYMLCLTNNVEDAEDLTQDSILKAKSRIRSYRGESGLKTWVHRVAFHTFTHWNRKQHPRARLSPHLRSGEESYGQVDATQSLLSALAQINPALAQPLVLYEINSFSVDEIARVLEIPVGTVKSRLSAARERLKQILGENHVESR
jgi:RNA polymerase sigma-70 factor (ECF subfamily)